MAARWAIQTGPNTLDPNALVSGNWQDLLNQADSVDLDLS
jgi:hypothetical protein